MTGAQVLEEILKSIEEAGHFGINEYKEVIVSRNNPAVRKILQAGAVLGVQEFEAEGFGEDDLIGKKVDFKTEDPFYESPDKTVHLYKVIDRLKDMPRSTDPCAFKDNHWDSRETAGIFEANRAFDSICRDFDFRFTEGLKPAVKYSIVTPVVRIDFPIIGSWRGNVYGTYRPTNGTAVVHTPFRITPNAELRDIMEYSKKTAIEFLPDAKYFFEQAVRIMKAVQENPNFQKLTQHYLELSKQLDEKHHQAHIAGIGRL